MRALIVFPLLLAATDAPVPQGGLWQIVSVPGVATRHGRPLTDLPYTPSPPDPPVCMTTAAFADPVALIEQQTPESCRATRRMRSSGRVTITGVCPINEGHGAQGRYTLIGRWNATSYAIRYTTSTPSPEGMLGFSGTMTATRLGDCPASVVP